ncbi:FtsX-like permease family protein, partial [Paraclostridium benzoelyticum]|nr:FtsX-like permease family protein [Paraclostridium benzoelyticum]
MYFKLAFENVRKSFKIYRIYFLTMGLAVSIFYSFNSIESQQAILDLSKSKENPIDLLINSIEIISIFVSFILGGLILYANNFLIKKRKKELGIYRTLGMSNLKISQVIVIETVIVGILSLVVGLLIGLVLSQGLSAFASKLFEVDMSKYKFIISSNAIQKTIVYFGIIFLIVMIFNVITISRYKIIDLVNASKKVENIKFKNPIGYV